MNLVHRRLTSRVLGATMLLLLVQSGEAGAEAGKVAPSSASCANVAYGSRATATPDAVETRGTLPPNPSGPTQVGLQVFVVNLREISPRTVLALLSGKDRLSEKDGLSEKDWGPPA